MSGFSSELFLLSCLQCFCYRVFYSHHDPKIYGTFLSWVKTQPSLQVTRIVQKLLVVFLFHELVSDSLGITFKKTSLSFLFLFLWNVCSLPVKLAICISEYVRGICSHLLAEREICFQYVLAKWDCMKCLQFSPVIRSLFVAPQNMRIMQKCLCLSVIPLFPSSRYCNSKRSFRHIWVQVCL